MRRSAFGCEYRYIRPIVYQCFSDIMEDGRVDGYPGCMRIQPKYRECAISFSSCRTSHFPVDFVTCKGNYQFRICDRRNLSPVLLNRLCKKNEEFITALFSIAKTR